MPIPFIGRQAELDRVKQLIQDKQGAVFAITGNAGIGKSSLLRQIAKVHHDKGQVFIDMNDTPPLKTAVEFLQYVTIRAQGLKHTKEALSKINGTYKDTAALISPYQALLQETVQLGVEQQCEELELNTDEKSKIITITKTVLQLVSIWSKNKQEKAKAELGDPELVLLKALKQDCKNHPLIFIDTYERLQAAQELCQQKIASRYGKPHETLNPVKSNLSFNDWLERLLDFLKKEGAIIIIAGRRTGCWRSASELKRFNDKDIANVVAGSDYSDLQALLTDDDKAAALLKLLNRLSFNGIPLWLQLALNFVSDKLNEGYDIKELAAMNNIDDLFAEPELSDDLNTANIDNARCKLALINRVVQHNTDLKDQAWQIALPRRLDKTVLKILFAEQADTLREAFIKAGLLETEKGMYRLHEEIRDLLLAYARYKDYLESETTKTLHQQLADSFAQRYQQSQATDDLVEQLYHQLMTEEQLTLDSIKDTAFLFDMALKLQAEQQYAKMTQVLLRLIAIQSEHENYWYGLGVALGHSGKLDEAIAAYRTQVKVKPNHESAWNNLGNALYDQGKLDEAIGAYRTQVEIKPNDEWAWNNLGNAYCRHGDLEQAQQAYAQVLTLNPQELSSLSNDAELALVQQDTARCLQRITTALMLVTNKDDLYVILPFLAWLAEPDTSLDTLYQAIQQFDHSVKITWDFTDTEPVLLRLNPEQQSLARQFIAYFQGSGDLPADTNEQ